MKLPFLLLLLAAVGLLSASESRSRLHLRPDGAYVDVVLAIDMSSPEDPSMLEKIKSMLTEFSEQLSVATKPMFSNGGSLRLGEAFILVPKTWTNTTVNAASTWQTYETSNIRLGNSPGVPHYTYHGGNCTRIGDYVMFDSSHVLTTDAYWLGKQLVMEFGRYRWGLRSEHNGEKGPHYYLDGNNNTMPTICTSGIRGSFRHNKTQLPCRVDRNSLELEPHCRFYPDLEQSATASLLTTTSVRDIRHFCDHWHSAPEATRHNKWAPVPLNHFSCGAHSGASDLMRKGESKDFDRPPTSPHPQPLLPVQFTVVRPPPHRRLVILMDVSTSMGGDPINKIKTGMDKFIKEMLENGIELALVTFSYTATTVMPLGFLDSEQQRERYAQAVRSLIADGYTAIGDGLVLAMRVLGADPMNPSRDVSGYILLLTDGQENTGNITLPQAADLLKKTSITVDSVTFGPQADKRLTELSQATGGYSFFTRFENSTNDFLEQLSQMVRTRVDSKEKPIDIFSAQIEQQFSIPINVDSSVGMDTSFLLTTYRASDIASMDLRVVSPKGTVYDKSSPEYIKDTTLGTVTIKLNGQIQSGQWTVTDGSSARRPPRWSNAEVVNTRAALTVSSKPASQEVPVVLDGSVVGATEIHLDRSSVIAVAASMMRGGQLLRGARILAKVESETGVDDVLQLQDNGVFPDVEADDGIYSGQVSSKSIMKVQEYNVRLISEHPVSRVTSAGKIVVKSVDTGSLENLPPSSVQDLRVGMDLKTQTVRLSWTATGDEQNQGTAARYVIKTSANATALESNFESADDVPVSVTPLPAGSAQSVNISSGELPSYNGITFYLAVRAVSSKGVASAVSNLVAARLSLPDNIDSIDGGPTTTLVPEVPTTTTGSRSVQSCGRVLLLLSVWLMAGRAAAL